MNQVTFGDLIDISMPIQCIGWSSVTVDGVRKNEICLMGTDPEA